MVVGQDGREVPGDYQGKHISTDHSKRPQICNRLVQETVPPIPTQVSRQPGVLGIGCNVDPLRKWGVVSNVNGSTLHLSSLALSSARPGTLVTKSRLACPAKALCGCPRSFAYPTHDGIRSRVIESGSSDVFLNDGSFD